MNLAVMGRRSLLHRPCCSWMSRRTIWTWMPRSGARKPPPPTTRTCTLTAFGLWRGLPGRTLGCGPQPPLRRCHICTATGPTPCHIFTGTGLTPCHICTGTGRLEEYLRAVHKGTVLLVSHDAVLP